MVRYILELLIYSLLSSTFLFLLMCCIFFQVNSFLILNLFIFKLKDNCFTKVCFFLPTSTININQPQICICPLLLEPPSWLPAHPTTLVLQSPSLSSLSHTTNSRWLSISHMVMWVFRWNDSHLPSCLIKQIAYSKSYDMLRDSMSCKASGMFELWLWVGKVQRKKGLNTGQNKSWQLGVVTRIRFSLISCAFHSLLSEK